MTCDICLDLHSEYHDGRLAEEQAAHCRAHIEECDSCARYDQVVRRGLMALSGLPEIRPRAGARDRLLARLRLEGLADSPRPRALYASAHP